VRCDCSSSDLLNREGPSQIGEIASRSQTRRHRLQKFSRKSTVSDEFM
jgi:hypothetical protein